MTLTINILDRQVISQTFYTQIFFLTFLTNQLYYLEQHRCPTLSPFATCGDKRFKCVDRQLFRNVLLMANTLFFSQIKTKVATEIIWLETTDLEHRCPTMSPFATCGDKSFKCGNR